MIDLLLTEDQAAMRDAVRALLADRCTPASLRADWGGEGSAAAGRRWQALVEIGVPALTVPTQYGGLGLAEPDLVPILEEAGAAALPEPLMEQCAVVVPVLAEFGTAAQRERWLPRIASGAAVVSVVLTGETVAVGADLAEGLLIERAGELCLVERADCELTPHSSVDPCRRVFTVDFDPAAASPVGAGGQQAARWAAVRAAAGQAAVLVGVARRLLAETVSYTSSREQFGQPIASFQVIAHQQAAVLAQVEVAAATCGYAAHALAAGLPDAISAASVAKLTAGNAARLAADVALQCHGGIGFTWEHDLHIWLKRALVLEQTYGGPGVHRRLLAAELIAKGRSR